MSHLASIFRLTHLLKITKLAKRIFHSSLLRDDLASCCTRSKIEPKLIKRSVPTRWNSVAEMLNSALDIPGGLEKLVDLECHNQVAKTSLRRHKLNANEWKLLTQLRPILLVSHPLQFIDFIYLISFHSTSSEPRCAYLRRGYPFFMKLSR